jgi:hypothetical protein
MNKGIPDALRETGMGRQRRDASEDLMEKNKPEPV